METINNTIKKKTVCPYADSLKKKFGTYFMMIGNSCDGCDDVKCSHNKKICLNTDFSCMNILEKHE